MDAGDYVPNFSDSVLIHRSVVEELNSQIKVRRSTDATLFIDYHCMNGADTW